MMKLYSHLFFFAFLILSLSGCSGTDRPAFTSVIKAENFNAIHDGKQVQLYHLTNDNGMSLAITNFGARVVELLAPDRNGEFADIVLGHGHLDKYINYQGERFLGAAIGRVGNRIAQGSFVLDSVRYSLALNNAPNTLHGGDKGFDMVVWDAEQIGDSLLVLRYLSPDMQEGFPGNLSVTMTYELTYDNNFKITYNATTDKATPVNLTHHSFFNLAGEGSGTINDHILTINASYFTPVDQTLIPLGMLCAVESTPMDFRTAKPIGRDLEEPYEQLDFGQGYDHCWVIDRTNDKELVFAAKVVEPQSGRTLEVWTTEPAIQFYGGNFFDGKTPGKKSGTYDFRGSFALETQHFPDSPNQTTFPNTILRPTEQYNHVCIYKFGVE